MVYSFWAQKKGRNQSAALRDRNCEQANPGLRFILIRLKTLTFSELHPCTQMKTNPDHSQAMINIPVCDPEKDKIRTQRQIQI